jgi:hypothetical protein
MTRQAQTPQLWPVLLLLAACCAVSIEGLSFYESRFLSSKSTLPQTLLSSYQSLSHCSSCVEQEPSTTFAVSSSLPRQNSACSSWLHPSFLTTRRKSFLIMGKGDGKKRRKKKSPAAPTAPAPPQPQSPPPQRVSTDINIPVRMQIRYGQMHKQAAKQSGTSFRQKKVVRTKYRRTWGTLYRCLVVDCIVFICSCYGDDCLYAVYSLNLAHSHNSSLT